MFLGLHSSVIHKASRFSSSSELLSSFACFAISLLRSIPTPPPSLCFLLFPIHLYPLMLIFWFFVSFVSDISAICIFTAVRRDSMLSSFPFIPFGFIAAMVRFLFFLILTLLCFFSLCFITGLFCVSFVSLCVPPSVICGSWVSFGVFFWCPSDWVLAMISSLWKYLVYTFPNDTSLCCRVLFLLSVVSSFAVVLFAVFSKFVVPLVSLDGMLYLLLDS